MSLVNEKGNKERFSFSKLSSFHTCKYGYKQTYIDGNRGEGNCFSSYGIEVHSLLERYAKGELALSDLPEVYQWEFDSAVNERFPNTKFCPDMRKLYYEQGLDFLKNFAGYEGKKILEVESRFEYNIDDWIFNGVIDIALEDSDGKLIIQDYKSKSSFKTKREQAEYARQLYLYSPYIKEKYGKYPDTLRFLMFRKNNPVDIPFNEKDLDEALNWAKDTVREIRECWDFSPSCDEFFAQNLCNHRNYCDLRQK